MSKIVKGLIDEIIEAVMDECLTKESKKIIKASDPHITWYTSIRGIKTALERFVVDEEEQNYTAHFLEWRDKYWKRKLKILEWKSQSKHLTTSELYDFYNQAFHHTPKKGETPQ